MEKINKWIKGMFGKSYEVTKSTAKSCLNVYNGNEEIEVNITSINNIWDLKESIIKQIVRREYNNREQKLLNDLEHERNLSLLNEF